MTTKEKMVKKMVKTLLVEKVEELDIEEIEKLEFPLLPSRDILYAAFLNSVKDGDIPSSINPADIEIDDESKLIIYLRQMRKLTSQLFMLSIDEWSETHEQLQPLEYELKQIWKKQSKHRREYGNMDYQKYKSRREEFRYEEDCIQAEIDELREKENVLRKMYRKIDKEIEEIEMRLLFIDFKAHEEICNE